MQELESTEIQEQIAVRASAANRAVFRRRQERAIRRRPRDIEEQRILDYLCIRAWDRAVATGKIKILNDREWYYGFD